MSRYATRPIRSSASGSVLRMWVAIDQTVRLAPSSRPPIEPVVSTANTTSTARLGAATGASCTGSAIWSPRHGWSSAATVMVAAAAVETPYVTRGWRIGMGPWNARRTGFDLPARIARPGVDSGVLPGACGDHRHRRHAPDIDRPAGPGAAQPEPHVQPYLVLAGRVAAHRGREPGCVGLGIDRVAAPEPALLHRDALVRRQIDDHPRVPGHGEAAIHRHGDR